MRFTHSPAMRAWMRANYTLSASDLAIAFNKRFDCARTPVQVHTFRKQMGLRTGRTGQFQKGHVPFTAGTKGFVKANAGTFKKGNVPANHRKIGSERVNVDGYIEIKVSEPNVWRHKQRVVWESHHGEIPDGMCVTFRDDDPLNCCIENLELITRAENAVFNKHFGDIPAEMKPVARNISRLKILSSKRRK